MFEVREEIIKNAAVVPNTWGLLRLDETDTPETVVVPAGQVIVPLLVWQAQRATLAARLPDIGVWLASDERPEELAADVDVLPVIAVDFRNSRMGAATPSRSTLRARLGFRGELRAIGDVLRDHLFSMHRVGFDAYATRPDRSIHDALELGSHPGWLGDN